MNTLSNHIKTKRKELRITTEELSVMSGISVETIQRIEQGQGCQFKEFAALLNVLNLKPIF